MSWSNNNEFVQKLTTQNIFEKQTTRKFDKPGFDQFPTVAVLILLIWGFGMVHIMGIDPKQAHIAYLVVKINHYGFGTCVLVWSKVYDGVGNDKHYTILV